MIVSRIWLARDGWRVEITDGARTMQWGAYSAEPLARGVAARLVAQLAAERGRVGQRALFGGSA